MNTTVTLMQTALILGVSMAEVNRLVRQHKLTVCRVVNKVKHLDANTVLAYIRGNQS